MTPAEFRTKLPEFQSTTDYPDTIVQSYLNLAEMSLNPSRWKNLLEIGTLHFVAHYLTLYKTAQNTVGKKGGTSLLNTGLISMKSVGQANVTYDTAAVVTFGAGHWNMTRYGIIYSTYVRMVGAGGIQI